MKKVIICITAIFLLISVLTFGKDARVHGGNAMDYFNLGLESSLTNKKIAYFTKALELDPGLALAYQKRGMFYYFQEKYDRVVEDYSNYLRLVSDSSDGHRMLGMAYLKTGDYNEAIINFDSAIALEPEMVAAYAYRAEAHRLSGKLQNAVDDATKAIALKGDPRIVSDAYRTRSRVYREVGQDTMADADFNHYFELNPRFVFYKYLSRYASLEQMRTAGLFGLVGIAFIMIFGFRIKPPEKDE
ncbi:tetratricopeptide repeat protein [Thermodesulfobacteriota bacterium]